MAQSKKSGGPQTPEGKSKSAINAMKHGLSTMNVGEEEALLVGNLEKELEAFYEPQSPLEKLQISRIAICRAKLIRLYEQERVRLQLVAEELVGSPKLVMDRIPEAKEITKALALEKIQYGTMTLPCRLETDQLEQLVLEIERFHGVLKTEAQLAKVFPTLMRFVEEYGQYMRLDAGYGPLDRLNAIINRIKADIQNESPLRSKFEKYLRLMELGMQAQQLKLKEQEDKELEEFMQSVSSVSVGYGTSSSGNKKLDKENDLVIDQASLLERLKIFKELNDSVKRVDYVIDRFHAIQSLLSKSIALPAAESDLLMRYQTTLERRLSSAIGELLELQKRR